MDVASNPLLGVALHAVGATFAATCYTPEKRVRGWSWRTYWIIQASFCWLVLVAAVLFLTYGNYLGDAQASASPSRVENAGRGAYTGDKLTSLRALRGRGFPPERNAPSVLMQESLP